MQLLTAWASRLQQICREKSNRLRRSTLRSYYHFPSPTVPAARPLPITTRSTRRPLSACVRRNPRHDRRLTEHEQLQQQHVVAAPAGLLQERCARPMPPIFLDFASAEGNFVRESTAFRVMLGESDRVGGGFEAGDLGEGG